MLRTLAARPFFGLAALCVLAVALAAIYLPSADRRGGIALLFIGLLFAGLAAALVAAGYRVAGRRLAARRATAAALLLLSPHPSLVFAMLGVPITALMLLGTLQLAFRDTSDDWRREVERQWASEDQPAR